ncbi:MFS transporter [Ramlibacter sp. USB13]|uniref:MFS transporter n=1 Tax=Ramlibacter cellulosilyticus TaxID=2764187 RepID=A0A923MUN8_9BURK|nr:MFS transporter [Ramlibacter cellulosilyticus]MBC5786197.1 MFS transporter [Ramlibacter cellulosilyticus]
MTARWYFGWNIVAAAAVLTLLSTGMRLSFGPFFLPMAHDLGFSRSLLATIVAVGMITYGLAMPLAGALIARHGTRPVLLAGTVLVVGSVLWTVATTDTTAFLLSFGVLLSVGLAFVSPVSLTPVISHWFTRQRGMALFFLSTGSMAGMAVMTPVLSFAIQAFGWRPTLVGFAAAFTVFTLPAALFVIRDSAPEHTDLDPSDFAAQRARAGTLPTSLKLSEAMRTAPFWKIFFGLFACGFSMNLLGTHGMPMLMDHGFDAFTSSMGIGVIGFVAIGGTLLLGRFADRLPRRHILASIYFVRGLGFFALVLVGTHWELYLASAIGGLVWAGSIALSSAILADVYGVRLVGVLYGMAYLGHQIGGMISSWLGGWGYEHFGTHWVAFGSAGVLLFAAGVVALQLPRKGFTLMAPAIA